MYKDLQEIEFVDRYVHEIKHTYPDINSSRLIYEVGRKLTHHLIYNLLLQTRINIVQYNIKTEEDIRELGMPLVNFTDATCMEIKLIKDFLMRKVYKHHRVALVALQSQNVVRDLFKLYVEHIELLPFSWRERIHDDTKANTKMSVIADYIAGMTDRFAIKQYQSFYNVNFASTDL